MINKIKQIWNYWITEKILTEGSFADEYTDPELRSKISARYRERFADPGITPHTHPWRFDPLNPPNGWRYDPYYEIWLNMKED